ncbi:pyridoxamine 5'-phosphate oxidase family protein [Nitrosopumilus sp. S4]
MKTILDLKLTGRLEIKSYEKIKEFLFQEHVGRIGSMDENGFPQIIPMNFAFLNDAIYMHSYTIGEKLDNIARNDKVGFEVDRELEFLPSYFSHPTDASQADTLYISVVIKGIASIVEDDIEKSLALNALMEKYQPEGHYDPLTKDDLVLDEVAVIKIVPQSIRGKYKIGQHMRPESRAILAQKILERNSPTSKKTLEIMGFQITDDGLKMVDDPIW